MVYMDVVTKYNVGQLNECIIDEKINGGRNILIPLNMKLLRATNNDFDGKFSLNIPLYFSVEFGKSNTDERTNVYIIEYDKENGVSTYINFPFNESKKMVILEYALEGYYLKLLGEKGYIPYHNMK